jgi:mRNA-degrading endonuclease RelE of RelBE toxin-antitoxin system
VRPAVLEFLANSLATDPYRVGHPLERELAGLHSARRGEYRVIYEVRPETREVIVLRAQHRRDAYRPR